MLFLFFISLCYAAMHNKTPLHPSVQKDNFEKQYWEERLGDNFLKKIEKIFDDGDQDICNFKNIIIKHQGKIILTLNSYKEYEIYKKCKRCRICIHCKKYDKTKE